MLGLGAVVGLGIAYQEYQAQPPRQERAPTMGTKATPTPTHWQYLENIRMQAFLRYVHLQRQYQQSEQYRTELRAELETELEVREPDIQHLTETLYEHYGCHESGGVVSDGIIHYKISQLGYQLHQTLGEHRSTSTIQKQLELLQQDRLELNDTLHSIGDDMAQGRYLEKCIFSRGEGLLELYTAYHQALEDDDCGLAFELAREIDSTLLQFSTFLDCEHRMNYASIQNRIDENQELFRSAVSQMSENELAEAARHLSANHVPLFMEGCLRNRSSFFLDIYTPTEAQGYCLADVIRGGHFDQRSYPLEDLTQGIGNDSPLDQEVRCQLRAAQLWQSRPDRKMTEKYQQRCVREVLGK